MKIEREPVKSLATGKPERSITVMNRQVRDWGVSMILDSELDALRMAYEYRFNQYGLKIEPIAGSQFMLMVFNSQAAKMGIGC